MIFFEMMADVKDLIRKEKIGKGPREKGGQSVSAPALIPAFWGKGSTHSMDSAEKLMFTF